MTPSSSKFLEGRWPLFAGALVAVLLGVLWARGRAAAQYERDVMARVAELQRQIDEDPGARPALYGVTTEDRAWPHYERALDIVGPKRGRIDAVAFDAAATASDEASRAVRNALLAKHAAVFPHLEAGAHARFAAQVIDWERGFSHPTHRLLRCRVLSHLTVAEARRRAEGGDDVGAVHTLLDGIQFGRDMSRTHVLIDEVIGVALLVPLGLPDWLEAGGATDLSPEAGMVWLEGLRKAEQSLGPELNGLLGDTLHVARGLESIERRNAWDEVVAMQGASAGILERWRVRSTWNDWVPHIDGRLDRIQRLSAASCRSGVDLIAEAAAWDALVSRSPNGLTRILNPRATTAVHARLRARLRLSMLRHALALQLGEASDPLPASPFGTAVQVARTPDEIRIWAEIDARDTVEWTLR